MNTFQIGGLILTGFFAALTAAAWRSRRLSRRAGAGWLVLWMTAAAAILRPELTVPPARLLGIQRGADLVVYCAILGMLAGFFALFVRLRRLDHALTEVVRHLALLEAPDRAEPEQPAASTIASGTARPLRLNDDD